MTKGNPRYLACTRAKSNAHYTCQECGSTEFIQAHHQIPDDDSSIIVLCAKCHSQQHPNLPKRLFFVRNHQPYWENISASSLARELGKHPRTIWRTAQRLNIPKGILTNESMDKIRKTALHLYAKSKRAKAVRPIPRGTLPNDVREKVDKALAQVHQITGKQPCVVAKWIYGKPYLYQTRSERNGNKIRQIFVRYIGRAEKLNIEEIVNKLTSHT